MWTSDLDVRREELVGVWIMRTFGLKPYLSRRRASVVLFLVSPHILVNHSKKTVPLFDRPLLRIEHSLYMAAFCPVS